tara:strand:+ start:730 stop:1251 length:522 start_codon:yes stop_codon:yes gene_type:complete
MNKQEIINSIRTVPDFPKKGIQFKDITTLLQEPELFSYTIDIFYEEFKNSNIDTVVGIESRGFIFAAPLALRLNCGMVLARKPGKLPSKIISEEYSLEYGEDSIEMHVDSINVKSNVLIVDDLLATGGTAKSVCNLVAKLGGKIHAASFLIILKDLNGKEMLPVDQIFSILEF